MSRVDAIHISGAGPAGLSAAITVARAGVRAIVHERLPGVGLRFHGDFQGIENWTTASDVLDELATIGIEPTFDRAPFRELSVFGPDGQEHAVRSREPLFYLVRRGAGPGTLDSALAAQATMAGVEIQYRDRVRTLPSGGIVAEGPRAADAIAVGYVFETTSADGAWGAVAERLAPGGYAYLVVHAGRGTIASVLFDDFHSENQYLERTVDFFARYVGVRPIGARRFGGRGNFHVPRRATRGRLLFAGESAGFQDALWGFGMRYAMISGHLAARALVAGDPESYDAAWRQRIGGQLKTSIVNRWAYARLGDRGYAAILARSASTRDLRAWLRRSYAASIPKALLFPLAQRSLTRRDDLLCEKEGCSCTWCRCASRAS